jgi:endo-1,4-beta-xylanase
MILLRSAVSHAQTLPLRASADEQGFFIGAAVAMTPLRNEPIYQETLKREFNILVAENAFKWDALRPSRTTFNFVDSDALVEFAQSNNMRVRGHTLVWHNQLPGWLTAGNFTREEVAEILRDHITTLVGRYKGRVWAWDVVNEAVDDATGGLRTNSFWHQRLGPEYIRLAFEIARQADPDARLYYNDYSIEGLNRKSETVYNLLRDLKSEGAPVDGVGWQMHQVNGFRVEQQHHTNAQRLAALGLELSITEMDVRITLPTTSGELQQQAEAYADVISFCLTERACKALVMWGFTDKHSWIPGFFSGWGDALIFDMGYQPKPSYFALKEALERGVDLSPRITGASTRGKKLFIDGRLFVEGAELFVNGKKARKVSNDFENPTTQLVAKKSGKTVKPGDILVVMNPDGLLSNEFMYP